MYGDNVEIYDNTSNYLDSECRVVGLMGKTSKIICWMIIIMGGIILLIVFSFYTIQYQKIQAYLWYLEDQENGV